MNIAEPTSNRLRTNSAPTPWCLSVPFTLFHLARWLLRPPQVLLIWSSRPVVLPSTLDTVFGLSKDIKNTGMYESQPVNVVYKHVRVCVMFLMFFALFTYLHPFSCHIAAVGGSSGSKWGHGSSNGGSRCLHADGKELRLRSATSGIIMESIMDHCSLIVDRQCLKCLKLPRHSLLMFAHLQVWFIAFLLSFELCACQAAPMQSSVQCPSESQQVIWVQHAFIK